MLLIDSAVLERGLRVAGIMISVSVESTFLNHYRNICRPSKCIFPQTEPSIGDLPCFMTLTALLLSLLYFLPFINHLFNVGGYYMELKMQEHLIQRYTDE